MAKGKSMLAGVLISINGFLLGLKRKVYKSPVEETYNSYNIKKDPSEELKDEILTEKPRYKILGLTNDHNPKMKR